ncbi:Hpt domain-containing protein [Sulfurimonas sp.]|uniref:Hpt domain-containing protein n=1 Tax=Sulfurimonas sp. TaxID=2022749 RepID=UPI003D12DCC8
MLIYNYKKEFIGIDEKDLKTLGLENLAQLRSEAADFADLFVKTPGFVHNFQHVHWIDYISCADSSEQPQVVINANGNLFKATVTISSSYLADSPTQKAYIVNLNHLRGLTDAEKNSISADLLDRPIPSNAAPIEPVSFTSEVDTYDETPKSTPSNDLVEDEYDTVAEETLQSPDTEMDLLSIDDVVDDAFELHPELQQQEDVSTEIPDRLDIPESIEMEEKIEDVIAEVPQKEFAQPQPSTEIDEDLEKALHSDYVYNPQIASDELGLPLDLIEEFIEDFINQAKEFKPGLYSALDEGDIDNVKILSHKLKGVAANLRIEDALEVLTTVNTTSDINAIKKNLDIFYVIIAKLAGEELALNVAPQNAPEEVEEEMVFDLKDDTSSNDDISLVEETAKQEENTIEENDYSIADDDVPEQIELPELADDNFVVQNEVETDLLDTSFEDELLLKPEETSAPQSYSKEQIANEIGVDSEALQELLGEFNSEAKDMIATMKTALHNSDLDLVKAQARQLKGMSSNIRFTNLSNEIQTLLDVDNVESASNEVSKIEALLEQISVED